MTNKKSIKFMFFLGIILLSLALLPSQAWSAAPVDQDGDGVKSNKDCDDTDPEIYPGSELCDEKDNQCPGDAGYGTVDEDCVACTDGDGDGFCVDDSPFDCNDDNADVYPGAPELCGDTIDNQCPGDSGTAIQMKPVRRASMVMGMTIWR